MKANDNVYSEMNIELFEKEVSAYISMGAGDRKTAIKWMMDANFENLNNNDNDYDDDDEDEEYNFEEIDSIENKISLLEKEYNLPSGYLEKDSSNHDKT